MDFDCESGRREYRKNEPRDSKDTERDCPSRESYGRRPLDRPSYDYGPKERPKLQLAPRTKPIESVLSPSESVSNSSIFGGAKPVDTAAREREIEERLLKVKENFAKDSKERGDDRVHKSSIGPSFSSYSRRSSDSIPSEGYREKEEQIPSLELFISIQQSLKDFFEDTNNKGAVRVSSKKEAENVLDSNKEGLAAAATTVLESVSSQSSNRESDLDNEQTLSTLKFITWNADGLNEEYLEFRTEAICKEIELQQADIVFLQEVVPESASCFSKLLPNYHCTFGREDGYFVGTLVKKSSVAFLESKTLEFPVTRMDRHVLQVNVTYKNIPICLLNSHLESLLDGSDERKLQLKLIFRKILKIHEKNIVIFAGDTNLRERELTEVGGLPAGIEDLWVTCGSRKECAYTFDMTKNDNLDWKPKLKPRCRYDRVYIRHSSLVKLKPLFFGLIGLERLLPHRCFPSDHFGILCHFELE